MRKTFLTTHFQVNQQKKEKKTLNGRLISFLQEWSWTISWTLLCAICAEYALQARNREYKELQYERMSLEQHLQEALILNKKLMQQINSQEDPAWIELVLMRKLGLVPEDQVKVVFAPGKE